MYIECEHEHFLHSPPSGSYVHGQYFRSGLLHQSDPLNPVNPGSARVLSIYFPDYQFHARRMETRTANKMITKALKYNSSIL